LKKLFIVIVTALLLTACGGGSKPAVEITLEARDFAFSVPSITVMAGEPVQLTLKNMGRLGHDFVIEKIDADTTVIKEGDAEEHPMPGMGAENDLHISAQVGETSVIQFTVVEPGTYPFFCSVAGHKEAGMVGELIVVAEK
jgi:uncharacterized cupredoxin-like copper-binding protein